jgi:broad specificity phosphatase PhoE
MTEVLLVRHGATDWNLTNRAQGKADVALNDVGRAQARAVAERLAGTRVDAVVSSDLARALDTARAIAAVQGIEVVVEPGFREIDQGEWTGLGDHEIRARWPREFAARHVATRPGGESPEQVRRRALAALERAIEPYPGGTVVIVTHGVTIRTLIAESLGCAMGAAGGIRGLSNGGIVALRAERRDGRVHLGRPLRWDGRAPSRHDPNQ